MGSEIEVIQWTVSDLELVAAKAFTLMLLAQSGGIHPLKATQRYHIISGKPAMKADAMLTAKSILEEYPARLPGFDGER